MEQQGKLLSHQPGQGAHAQLSQLADGVDAVCRHALFGFLSHPEQVSHTQRPHLFLHFAFPEGMHLVRLLEIGGHLCKEFVGADAHIHGEAQPGFDLVFEPGGHFHCIFRSAAKAHVDEALIDGELLQHRGITAAYGDKTLRAGFVPCPVATDDDQLRVRAKRHRHWLRRLDAEFFGRDGCCRNDAPAVVGVSGYYRGHQPDVRLSFTHHLHRRPAEECGVHIDMEDDAGQNALLQVLFQKLGCVCHAIWAVSEGFSSADAF